METVLRLFVSSPGDVAGERRRIDLVVDRLNAEFAGRVRIETVRWELSYYSAHETFQRQIPEAAECDVVVAVFRGRLGTPLPAAFPPLPSGEPYPSGTAYEILSAMEVRRAGKRVPDVYVFRYPDAPTVGLDAPDRAEVEGQWARLKQFFDTWFRTQSGEFLAAFQTYGSTDDFAHKVEDCLRQWLAQRGYLAQGAVWDRVLHGSPFPGLAAFEADRGRVFFGRDMATGQAVDRLHAAEASGRAPFLLVIGASGSGKSSLLRAGLLPRLVLPGTIPEVDAWRVAVLTPGAAPFAALAEALFADAALGAELRGGTFRTREMLAKQLAGDPETALAPLRDALERVAARRQAEAGFDAPRPARLALGIDQAERLFTEASPEVAARLAGLLSALVHGRLATVVTVLRSDAYAAFQGVEALVALREAGATLDLLPPTAGELEEIVTRPVALCQPPLGFEQRDGRSLAGLLVADARGGDALPLLQVSLARLYAAEAGRGDGVLRFADYSGMDAAVTQTANEALGTLDAAARAELPALVAGLVADVGVDARTGASVPVVQALDRRAFETGPARAALVEAFVAKRLLTAEGDGERPLVRPVHEALLRIWPQAVAIVAETASLIRVRHSLAPLVRAWAEAPADAKAAHLDLSPALLDGAQGLLARFGADLPADTRTFIADAAAADAARRDRERADQERRIRDAEALAAARRRTARRTMAGLAAALVLAVLAGWQGYQAQQQNARAQRSLTLAIQTATGLVTNGALKYNTAPGTSGVVKIILDHARQMQEQLISAGEMNGDLLRSQALALAISADMLRVMGDTSAALADATHAQTIMRKLLAEQASDTNYGGVTIADIYTAIAEYKMGNIPAALADVQEALAISQRFASAHPEQAIWQNLLFTSQRGMGLVLLAQGDMPGALAHFEAALAMVRPLGKGQPATTVRGNYAIAYAGIGAVQQEQGNVPAALANDRRAVVTMEANAKAEPANTLFQDGLATGWQKLGEVQLAGGDLSGALASQRASLVIRERLAKADPENAALRAEAAETTYWLGRVLETQGDLPGALAAYRDAASASGDLAKSDPSETVWHRDFAVASGRASVIELRNGDAAASGRLRQARDMLMGLAQRSPSSAQLKKDLAWIDGQIGGMPHATAPPP